MWPITFVSIIHPQLGLVCLKSGPKVAQDGYVDTGEDLKGGLG